MEARSVLIVTAFLVTGLLTACESKEPEEAVDAEGAETEGNAATASEPQAAERPTPEVVVVARDFAFGVSEPVPAGATTLRLQNQGRSTHHLVLYKLSEGRSVSDLLAAVKALPSGSGWPAWAEPAGGPGGVSPGGESNATLRLEPGSYAAACWVPDSSGIPHLLKGMVTAVQVGPAEAGADRGPAGGAGAEPDLDLTLVEYDFEFAQPIASGRRVVRVTNGGRETHEVHFWRLAPGKTVDDLLKFVRNDELGERPGIWVGGMSELKPGGQGQIAIDFQPGDYVSMCFIPDEEDGRPHFMHGMVKQIHVE